VLEWADNAIRKTWLQVTVLANARTGLASADVFYFGNAVGESGNSAANAQVNATDETGARATQRSFLNRAPVDFRWDYNRDSLVNATDQTTARFNQTSFVNALRLITPPAPGAAALPVPRHSVWSFQARPVAWTPGGLTSAWNLTSLEGDGEL